MPHSLSAFSWALPPPCSKGRPTACFLPAHPALNCPAKNAVPRKGAPERPTRGKKSGSGCAASSQAWGGGTSTGTLSLRAAFSSFPDEMPYVRCPLHAVLKPTPVAFGECLHPHPGKGTSCCVHSRVLRGFQGEGARKVLGHLSPQGGGPCIIHPSHFPGHAPVKLR